MCPVSTSRPTSVSSVCPATPALHDRAVFQVPCSETHSADRTFHPGTLALSRLRHHIRPAAHKGRYCQAHRVAHFSSDVFHAAACYRCRTQGHAGTDAAFDNPCHAGHVHPSGDHREACGTNCSGLAFCGQEGKQGNLKGPKCWESLSRGWQWRVGRLLFPAELRLCLFGPFLCLRWDREFSVSY